LDDLCIRTPAATFFVRASGSSMEKAGIHDGDVLVVDRSLPPGHRKIVIGVSSRNGKNCTLSLWHQ